jgi:hypothetical protein
METHGLTESFESSRPDRSLFTAGALAVIRYAKIHGTQHRPWLTARESLALRADHGAIRQYADTLRAAPGSSTTSSMSAASRWQSTCV